MNLNVYRYYILSTNKLFSDGQMCGGRVFFDKQLGYITSNIPGDIYRIIFIIIFLLFGMEYNIFGINNNIEIWWTYIFPINMIPTCFTNFISDYRNRPKKCRICNSCWNNYSQYCYVKAKIKYALRRPSQGHVLTEIIASNAKGADKAQKALNQIRNKE